MSHRRVALACALVAVVAGLVSVAAAMSAQSWSVTALVRTASDDPIAGLTSTIDPDFQFVEPGGHYDGSFFYAVAIDPLARGQAHGLIDRAAYRYAHPGYGWAAWLVALGRPSFVPWALFLVGLAGMAVAAATASLIARRFGWSPWWGGLVVALSPGLLFSLTADTSEPIGLALMGLLLLAWLNRRWAWVAVLSVCVSLVKEPLLIVPIGLALWELIQTMRGNASADGSIRVAALAAGPIAFAAWNVYLVSRFHLWPASQASDLLTLPPFAGWVDTFGRAAEMAHRGNEPMQIGTFTIAVLPFVAGALLVGVVRAVRLRTFLDLMFLGFALIVFSLNWLQLLNPKDLIREVALAFVLLPAVLVDPGILPGGDRPSRSDARSSPAAGEGAEEAQLPI